MYVIFPQLSNVILVFLTLAAFLPYVIQLLMLCRKIANVANVYCFIETDFKSLNKVSFILYLEPKPYLINVTLCYPNSLFSRCNSDEGCLRGGGGGGGGG